MQKTGEEKSPSPLEAEISELQKELARQKEIVAKTQHDLARIREEMVDFSFVVAHNLRGPVATIEGLIGLLNRETLSTENAEYISYIEETVREIDNIAHDLGRIVSTQHAVADVYQVVDLKNEMKALESLLEKNIRDSKARIHTYFDPLPKFISSKEGVNTILHNLVSNSIKFRSPDRPPVIEVRSWAGNGHVCFSVRDNGLGIETERHQERLFKPYSRIHHQISGKGLGLYTVKLLAESLGGQVELESKPGSFTEVKVFLEAFPEGEEQIILDSIVARITYYARSHTMKAIWKRKINGREFEEIFLFIVGFMKKYNLKNWIADITGAANDEEELNAIRRKYNDRIHSVGLERMAIIVSMPTIAKEDLEQRKTAIRSAYNFPVEFFNSDKEAFEWIGKETQGTPSSD